MEAVRTAWAEGYDVTVVSPRLSAADLSVPIAGLFAGRRLRRTRRQTGADRLVLVVEEGFPLVDGMVSWHLLLAAYRLLSAYLLRSAIREFNHATVIRAGDCGCERATAIVLAGADEVVSRDVASPPPGVTVLGPAEMTPIDRVRWLAERGMKRFFPGLDARIRTTRRRLRRWL